MKTYKDIYEFIVEAFPLEQQIIAERKKSKIERFMEEAGTGFKQKLEAIIKGEKKEEEKTGNSKKTESN